MSQMGDKDWCHIQNIWLITILTNTKYKIIEYPHAKLTTNTNVNVRAWQWQGNEMLL